MRCKGVSDAARRLAGSSTLMLEIVRLRNDEEIDDALKSRAVFEHRRQALLFSCATHLVAS
jgi:hypothetical protein